MGTLACIGASALSGGITKDIADKLRFYAPLLTSAIPTKAVDPTYTFTRATCCATVFDEDGIMRTVLPDEIRFHRARRVENLCKSSANASSGWLLNGAATVLGDVLSFPNVGEYARYEMHSINSGGRSYIASFDISGTEGDTVSLLWITAEDGFIGKTRFMLTSAMVRQFVKIDFSSGDRTLFRFYVGRNTVDDTATTVNFSNINIEDVTGSIYQAPEEYLPQIDFGTNVLGVRCFDKKKPIKGMAFFGDSITNANHDLSMRHPWGQLLVGDYGLNSMLRGGVNGENSTQIKTRALASSSAEKGYITIIWAGRNNFSSQATVEADIAAIVADLTTTDYLVLSILNGEYVSEYSGGVDYSKIITLNNALSVTYGSKYFDIRGFLVSQYDSNIPQDVIDFGNDVPPSSLRFDNIHPNIKGYPIIADKLKLVIDALGYTRSNAVSVPLTGLEGYKWEPQSTNILIGSNDFLNNWSQTLTSATKDQIGLDGETSGWTLYGDGLTNYITTQRIIAITPSTDYYCFSFYIKKDPAATVFSEMGMTIRLGGVNVSKILVSINHKNGTLSDYIAVVGNAGHYIEDEGNYWRVCMWGQNDGTADEIFFNYYPAVESPIGTRSGTIAGSQVVTNFQLEKWKNATSYIPTDLSAVIRNKDVLSYPAINFDNTVGTTQAVFTSEQDATTLQVLDTGGTYPISISTGNAIQALDGTNTLAIGNSVATTEYKVAVRWSSVDSLMKSSINGGAVQSAAFDGAFTNTSLAIGSSGSGNASEIKTWGKALADAKLPLLTFVGLLSLNFSIADNSQYIPVIFF